MKRSNCYMKSLRTASSSGMLLHPLGADAHIMVCYDGNMKEELYSQRPTAIFSSIALRC